MSLLELTTETMVSLSARWLDPKRQRKQLAALPLIAPLLPVLQRAHDDLLAKERASSAIDLELTALLREAAERDRRHDRKIRGTHGVLTAFADLSDDPELARALLDLRDRLLPVGLPDMAHGGAREALPARLDEASRKLLARLPAADAPLETHVDAWIDDAARLARIGERRDELAEQLVAGDGGPSAAEPVAERHAWVRIVRAIEATLALDPDANEDVVESLLRPLRRAENKAERRRSAAPSTGPEEEDTLDAEPATPAVERQSAPRPDAPEISSPP